MNNQAEQFKQLLKILSANYNRTLTEPQVELLKLMAKQYGFKQFNTAIMAHMSDPDAGMYFPNMAHISKHIQGTTKENNQVLESKAQFQWMAVDRAIRELGSHRTPKFKDPVTSAAVSVMGGWVSICGSTTEQLVWKQKEFVRNYMDFTSKPIEQLPSHIQGREDLQIEKQNSKESIAKLLETFESKNN